MVNVLVNIFLFFIQPRDNEAKMVIVLHNRDSLTIKMPGMGVLEVIHINLRPCDGDLSLISVKLELLLLRIVTNNV